MKTDELRRRIQSFLGVPDRGDDPGGLVVRDEVLEDGYSRKLVSYSSEGDRVDAFLFEPAQQRREAAVVALHQHNSQWHLGKSEVAGLIGDPFQAFGPALARRGVTVLAPDSIGFESRRASVPKSATGTLAPALEPGRGGTNEDWLQYYNQAMHRIARGDLLMRKILVDVGAAVIALAEDRRIAKVGILGHSFGGTVALFSAALDPELAFVAASGAACSYRYKFAHGVGLDMALVIPGFAAQFDLEDLFRCIAPRPLLIVSGEGDGFSADADDLVARASAAFPVVRGQNPLRHARFPGGHALDRRRFDVIVKWVVAQG